MSKTILYAAGGVELVKDEQGKHFLSVLVGGIAQYSITIVLTKEELDFYREFGNHYIQKLALSVCQETELFLNRSVSPV